MRWLDRAALLAALALPVAMLHGRALAEILMAVVIAGFLARSVQRRDWTWLRTPWLLIGLLWWG